MSPDALVPPPNWRKRYPNGYSAGDIFNPQEDEHFQVWMRTSWYPTFRKLYSALREGMLEAGTYEVNVTLSKIKITSFMDRSTKSKGCVFCCIF